MFLTGALVLFGAGTTPQVVTALAVCILWFGIIANLKPFGAAMDDRLAQVEGIQILFTLLIGLVLQLQAAVDGGSKEDEEALGVVLIILNLAVIALALVQQPLFLKVVAGVGRIFRWAWKRIHSRIRRRRENAAAAEAATSSTTHSATTVNMLNPFVSHNHVEMTGLSPSAKASSAPSTEDERDSARTAAGASTKTSTDHRAENDKMKQEIERLRVKNSVLETEIADARAGRDQAQQENEQLRAKNSVLESEIAEVKADAGEEAVDEFTHPTTLTVATVATGAADGESDYRVADGEPYTKAEFIQHYGGTDEWDDAPAYESQMHSDSDMLLSFSLSADEADEPM
jgi:hypothetical protein